MDLGPSLRELCCLLDNNINDDRLYFLKNSLAFKKWTSQERQRLLNVLSELLCDSSYCEKVASCFSFILKELFTRIAKSDTPYLQLFVSLSKLVGHYHDATEFAYDFFSQKKCSPFTCVNGNKRVKTLQKPKYSKKDVLLAAFGYLWQDPSGFRNAWDWSPVIHYTEDDDNSVKWLSMQIVRIIFDVNDEDFSSWTNQHFSREVETDLRLEYNYIFKTRRLKVKENTVSDLNTSPILLQPEDFDTTNICLSGILLKTLEGSRKERCDFVVVPTFEKHLERIALSLSCGEPILIEGPVGCGKTSLIEYVGSLTNRLSSPQLTKVQIGNQIDGKLLVGTYCCTDVPGEFVWKPGPLTSCLLNGHWLILEDFEYASVDVINIVTTIIKTRSLSSLPGCPVSNAKVNQDFRLFLTQRLSGSRTESCRTNVALSSIKKLSTVITLEKMTDEEIISVITHSWPVLKPIADKILQIFHLMVTEVEQNEVSAYYCTVGSRKVSLRDLFKWTNRISKNFCLNSDKYRMDVFLEACDCFLQSMPSPVKRLEYAEKVGAKLNLTASNARCLISERNPAIKIDEEKIAIGRVIFRKTTKEYHKSSLSSQVSIAYTKQFLNIMERAAACVANDEPVLLVGETGCGKTSAVQYLSELLGNKLTVVNLNRQSESTDLLGGYKPVELETVVQPMKKEFELLFAETFSSSSNAKFLGHISSSFRSQKWNEMYTLMAHVLENALRKAKANPVLLSKWTSFRNKLRRLKTFAQNSAAIAFAFVEGSLIKAMTEGSWILLDEINLAEADTLQCLSSLLDSQFGSILLSERADREVVTKHPDFRLFACMNPATDVGKKELPVGIRNRFTEFYVEELTSDQELQIMVNAYLKGLVSPAQVNNIVQFYKAARCKAETSLEDANGCKPHYSLRTLCRALRVSSKNPCSNIQRSIYEALCLSFLTQLNAASHNAMEDLIKSCVLGSGNTLTVLKNKIGAPEPKSDYVKCEGYWISKGHLSPQTEETYILTPNVKRNLKNLARIIGVGKTFPILLQGETSVGKTSMILFLAKASGNVCLRVNNHEHTDLQEYIGTYVPDSSGKLVFSEGVLVTAMRKGYWLILDELNLASSEVLEALNRVLDDNRELFIPETGETVKAHPKFILFATQNPPEHYGGRKQLSRAFRNRFIELHYDEIPLLELETILHRKCDLPLSYSKKMVRVLSELRVRRRESGVFFGKHSYITLRDLFRWGERYRKFAKCFTDRFYDWDLHIANDGFMLLAGRVRKSKEAEVILEVLENVFKRKLSVESLFEKFSQDLIDTHCLPDVFKHIVWTKNLKKNAVLLFSALKNQEPVLLIGETGCGKTTMCQLFAALQQLPLYTVNCHMHSESSDFLGSLRPVRDKTSTNMFEWVDGPLVRAMREGAVFLVDEISLADDSVLERLNSVLEPERRLLLAEKNIDMGEDRADEAYIAATESFRIVGTMNPGGDYGKKELSPALRNRFTEIWCESDTSFETVKQIVEHNLKLTDSDIKSKIGIVVGEFMTWFQESNIYNFNAVSARDILSVVQFINSTIASNRFTALTPAETLYHSLSLVFVDSTGIGTASYNKRAEDSPRKKCEDALKAIIMKAFSTPVSETKAVASVGRTDCLFGLPPFYITLGSHFGQFSDTFTFASPTTSLNTMKLLRAMQINKPVLLEGVPGIGKTSIISALAKASGYKVIRVNLSEQTDISDLFGADLPVEGEEGRFSWRDGPVLQALKSTDTWIVFDEINLASQSVLEGLNACFDHRGEIWICELSKTFTVNKQNTRIFACQNPHMDGGARKGLPKSFLNRFTTLYFEPLTDKDLHFILSQSFPQLPTNVVSKMVQFNRQMENVFGNSCGEFNLRDLCRWAEITCRQLAGQDNMDPGAFVKLIYFERFRTAVEKEKVTSLYNFVFGSDPSNVDLALRISRSSFEVFGSMIDRKFSSNIDAFLQLLPYQLPQIGSIMSCVAMNWMVILTGSTEVGKTSLIHLLSSITGHPLKVLSVNAEMDTIDLLGGFDQRSATRHFNATISKLWQQIKQDTVDSLLKTQETEKAAKLLHRWNRFICACQTTREITEEFIHNQAHELESFVDDLKDLSGKIYWPAKEALESLRSNFKCGNFGKGGIFEWIDSVLITALINGDWLLIDDVNLCPPSVLDRLNCLLEANGVLAVTEQGAVADVTRIIEPHPNFRLFLTMDPKNGELSRAMRNRGIEIYIPASDDSRNVIYHLRCLGVDQGEVLKDAINACEEMSAINRTSEDIQRSLIKSCVVKLRKLQLSSNTNLSLQQELQARCSDTKKTLSLSPEDELRISISCALMTDMKRTLGDVDTANVLKDSCIFNLTEKNLNEMPEIRKVFDSVEPHLLNAFIKQLFWEMSSPFDFCLRASFLSKCNLNAFRFFNDVSLQALQNLDAKIVQSLSKSMLPYVKMDLRYNCVLWNKLRSLFGHSDLYQLEAILLSWNFTLFNEVLFHIETAIASESNCDFHSRQLMVEASRMLLETINEAIIRLSKGENVPLTYEFMLWVHEFKLLLKSYAMEPNLDALRAAWSLISSKIRSSELLNGKEQVFSDIDCTLELSDVEKYGHLYKCIYKYSDSLSYFYCEKSANLFSKVFEANQSVSTCTDYAELLFVRDWFKRFTWILKHLSQNSNLSELEMELNCLIENVKQHQHFLARKRTENFEEENDSELLDMIKNRHLIERRSMVPLWQICFAHSEVKQLLGRGSAALHFISEKRILINPLHAHLVEVAQDTFNVNILLQHSKDFLWFFNADIVKYWLQKSHSHEDCESKIEYKFAPELTANVTSVAARILSNDTLKLTALDNKVDQIENLQAFLCHNYTVLSSSKFTFLGSQCDLLKRWSAALKETMESFKIHDSFNVEEQAAALNLLSNSSSNHIVIAKIFCSIGIATTYTFAPMSSVDPVLRNKSKLDRYRRELCYCKVELALRNANHLLHVGTTFNSASENLKIKQLLERINFLETKVEKLSKRNRYRPKISSYHSLRDATRHFLKSVLSAEKLYSLMDEISKSREINSYRRCIRKAVQLQSSSANFISQLQNSYKLYSDITNNFQIGLYITLAGLRILIHQLSYQTLLYDLNLSEKQFNTYIMCVSEFFSTNLVQRAKDKIAFADFLVKTKSDTVNARQAVTLFKSAFLDVQTSLNFGCSKDSARRVLLDIVTTFLHTWQIEEEERRAKLEEEAALYHYKSQNIEGELSEEEQEKRDVALNFPSFYEAYGDENSDAWKAHELRGVDAQDKMDLFEMHSNTLRILIGESKFEEPELDMSLRLQYEVLSSMVTRFGGIPDTDIDVIAIEAHLAMCSSVQSSLDNDSESLLDVYKENAVSEVKLCSEVLRKLENHVIELLRDFPGHPVLRDILKIIARMLDFSIKGSPIMKFLTGLELLLQVAQDWESKAHRGISLREQLDAITAVIVRWRKMELNNWVLCLDSVMRKIRQDQYLKWWFHFFSIITALLNEDSEEEEECLLNLLSSLKRFLETSTLGQFHIRKCMVHSFLSHIKCFSDNRKQGKLVNLFSNLLLFYSQFDDKITTKVASERHPVEKEVKGFVKIMRWNDKNFESLKSAIDKAHRTLNKHMKNFEKALQQPSQHHFLVDSEGPKECAWTIEVTLNIVNAQDSVFLESSHGSLGKIKHLYKKSFEVVKSIPEEAKVFQEEIMYLNDMASAIADALQEFDSYEFPDQLTDKEKWKKSVRRLHNRKQQSLSELWKALQNSGLSYRSGLRYYSDFNLDAVFLNCPTLGQECTLMSWMKDFQSMNKYFYGSLARFAALQSALCHPSKDLTANTFERIKGFSGALLFSAISDRSTIFEELKSFDDLKKLATQLSENTKSVFVVPQKEAFEFIQTLNRDIVDCTISFTYLKKLCASFTEKSDVYIIEEKCSLSEPGNRKKLEDIVNQALTVVTGLRTQFNSTSLSTKSIIMNAQMEEVIAMFASLTDACAKVIDCLQKMDSETSSPHIAKTLLLCKGVVRSESKLREFYQEASALSCEDILPHSLNEKCDNFLETLLKGLQSSVKFCRQFSKCPGSTKSDTAIDEIPDSVKCTGKLTMLSSKFASRQILNLFDDIIAAFHESYSERCSSHACLLLQNLALFLNQYITAREYFYGLLIASYRTLCKITYILLGLFTNLAQKGFCLPAEIQETDEKSKGQQFRDIENGGLGEGEGVKDVSKNIESEDQLEDTFQAGQERPEQEEEEKETNAEDDAVEMSDDFAGKAYSPEKEEREDSDSGEEQESDNEIDKKMGDVEEEDDVLDNEMWGDGPDSENEADEDSNQGGGESKDETRLVAKGESNDDQDKKNNQKEENNTENEEQDIEEINEQLQNDEYSGEHEDQYKTQESNKASKEDEELPEDMELDKNEDVGSGDEGSGLEQSGNESNDDGESLPGDLREEEPTGLPDDDDENKEAQDAKEGNNPELESESPKDEDDSKELDQHVSKDVGVTPQENAVSLPEENINAGASLTDASAENKEDQAENTEEEEQGICEETKSSDASDDKSNNKRGSKNVATNDGKISEGAASSQSVQSKKRERQNRNTTSLKTHTDAVERKNTLEAEKDDEKSKSAQMNEKDSDLYQHLNENEVGSKEVIDLAKEDEQNKYQPGKEEEKSERLQDGDEENFIPETEETMEVDQGTEQKQDSKLVDNQKGKGEKQKRGAVSDEMEDVIMETDVVTTEMVSRGDSTIHTVQDIDKDFSFDENFSLENHFINKIKLKNSMDYENVMRHWLEIERKVTPLIHELCHQLQLVLEPSKASKLKGDYKTGKRLNMRKVIAYIASQFRRDKIWLRRTKPNVRQYQIVLAVDDSFSMADSRSKELAFESLALLGRSLSLVEAGELAVMSFGESAKLLHTFDEPFTTASGAQLLSEFQFTQHHTRVAELLDKTLYLLMANRKSTTRELSQLLIIMSDGRGLYNEGKEHVQQSVKRLKEFGIFTVFIVLDNPANVDSILDIRVPVFDDSGSVRIETYIENFPFPYYLILRNIEALPQVLGEALRQWFELVTVYDK